MFQVVCEFIVLLTHLCISEVFIKLSASTFALDPCTDFNIVYISMSYGFFLDASKITLVWEK